MKTILLQVAGEPAWIDIILRGSFAVALAYVLWGGHKGWWVYGKDHRAAMDKEAQRYSDLERRHERLRHEKDAWMQTALKSAGVAFALTEGKESAHETP